MSNGKPFPPSRFKAMTALLIAACLAIGPGTPWGAADSALTAEAQAHAEYQAAANVLSHVGWPERSARLGGGCYEVCAYALASTYDDAADAWWAAWWRSPRHRSILLGAYSAYGFGYARRGNNWFACLILKR
jgi:uncharacterized protein YkwD